MDPPPGSPRSGLLPHARRPVAELGGRSCRFRRAVARRRLEHQQFQLAMVELLRLFLPGKLCAIYSVEAHHMPLRRGACSVSG